MQPLALSSRASLYGVLCLVTGIAVFSLQDLIIKLISSAYPLHEAMAIRGIVSLPLLLVMVARSSGLRALQSDRAAALLVRGVIMFSAYTAYYLGLAAIPIAICVSLYFVAPIFVTVLSALVLKEQVGPRRWAAVLLGFIGILIVLRPTTEVFDPASLLPIYGGFAYAVSAVLARRLGARESAPVMAFYANGIYLGAGLLLGAAFSAGGFPEEHHKSLAFLVRGWSMPGAADLLLLMACGGIAAFGTVLLTQAYRIAEASMVAPYEYTALIWSLIYGWVFWNEFPDAIAWAGIGLVVFSGIYTLSGAQRT
jgi:drug/metabolite transporter (DMT)-like permease